MNKFKIAVTGSTGLLGRAVVKYFKAQGHEVFRLIRPDSKVVSDKNDVIWDVISQRIDLEKLEGIDVVIHLAGENLAAHRWSNEFKDKILTSRVQGTTFLSGILFKLKNPPKVFLAASAVGYYGSHHGAEILDESSPQGEDFLAQLCMLWEEATKGAELAGIRVVNMRTAAVLGREGGALGKMLPIFRMGLGGPLGDGQQMFSWICVDEIPLAMEHIINSVELKGAVNLAAPNAVTNREFTDRLGRTLNRPTIFPIPAVAIRMMFGEMADAILLSSINAVPKKLTESGYRFKFSSLDETLKQCV